MTTSRELTARSLIIGAFITVIFTASNVYLGLRIGMTFATSIPAAVISMAVLRILGRSSLLENNIVQTQASAAGTLSCVFATLPGMILTGFWTHFPFWETAGICFAGGVMGVIFTIPLRRSLVIQSTLPYPEGVAAAEILKTGEEAANVGNVSHELKVLIKSCTIASVFSFLSGGLRLIKDSFTFLAVKGKAYFQFSATYSPALLGAGYLVGPRGGAAILGGCILTWSFILPYLTSHTPHPPHLNDAQFINSIWMGKIRFIGTGAIAIASLGTLIELFIPLVKNIKNRIQTPTHVEAIPDTAKDLSAKTSFIILGVSLFVICGLLMDFLSPYATHTTPIIILSLIFCLIVGFLLAAACGYMAGLIGSSTSPISGFIVMGVILCAFMLLTMEKWHLLPTEFVTQNHKLAITFTIYLLSIIIAIITISNDNLQDLKTGQLLNASPWRQEIALIVGCLCSALIIPPILNILYNAYGFAGSLPRPNMDPQLAFTAPQPAVIELISRGILTHSIDWSMLLIGVVIGVMIVAFDLILRRKKLSCPPLGVTLGIYMPQPISITLAIGGFLKGLVEHQKKKEPSTPQKHNTSDIMLASGFIVGESLMGVVLAIAPISFKNTCTSFIFSYLPFPSMTPSVLGFLAFIGLLILFKRKA